MHEHETRPGTLNGQDLSSFMLVATGSHAADVSKKFISRPEGNLRKINCGHCFSTLLEDGEGQETLSVCAK